MSIKTLKAGKKLTEKKNYLAVGALYLLKAPAGGADDNDEGCCRSPSILRFSSSFLVFPRHCFPPETGIPR